MRRILLFTRHYPPAVSGLAPRTNGLARALRAEGADVFVVAPSLPEGEPGLAVPHPHRDPPAQVGPPAFTLRALARELALWPDPDIRWGMRAARAALAAGVSADWVLSASPPESAHAAARWLAQRLGARWAADFTDLWLENPHRLERKRGWRRAGELTFARALVPKADLAMAVDSTIAAELSRFGAEAPEVLAHFHMIETAEPVVLPVERINVVCTGSFTLSAPENVIDPLLRAFEQASPRNPTLMLHIVGRLTDDERAAFAASPAAAAIQVHGVVSHAKALGFQAGADALAFACPPKLHVPPSKIVEYLAQDRPIVACGEGPWRADPRVPEGDPADVLAGVKKGDRRQAGLPAPQTAREAARRLLGLMDATEWRA
jgi:glycosyltransferase involved in cell wall biosynthesis